MRITCQNLFANGFWNTYNRQFSDLKHLRQESLQSETVLSVTYKFKSEAGKEVSGSGVLIKSTETEAIIWNSKQFVAIGKTNKVHMVAPSRTQKPLATEELFFSNISPDSLKNLTKP